MGNCCGERASGERQVRLPRGTMGILSSSNSLAKGRLVACKSSRAILDGRPTSKERSARLGRVRLIPTSTKLKYMGGI
jgi:hypothetical protein